MAKVDAYYSIRERDPKVHHDNNKCTKGMSLESYIRSAGTDGRPLCEHCEKLT